MALESEAFRVVHAARAAQLTMNREGIRRLTAEELSLATSPYEFSYNFRDFSAAIERIGVPCLVNPIMSSSGKGQSLVKPSADVERAWQYAQKGGRAGRGASIEEARAKACAVSRAATVQLQEPKPGSKKSHKVVSFLISRPVRIQALV